MPWASVPVLLALIVSTVVVKWRAAVPMASSASRRRWVAVTFIVLPAALMMLPASATKLTFSAVTLPTVKSVAAFKRAELFVAVIVTAPPMVNAPASASSVTVPFVAVVMFAKMLNAFAAVTVMWPVLLLICALLVTSAPVPFASMRTLPVPLATTPRPSVLPSLITIEPFKVVKTMSPLLPLIRSACADVPVLSDEVPAVATSNTCIAFTRSTLIAVASLMNIPPELACAAIFTNSVWIFALPEPILVPAWIRAWLANTLLDPILLIAPPVAAT